MIMNLSPKCRQRKIVRQNIFLLELLEMCSEVKNEHCFTEDNDMAKGKNGGRGPSSHPGPGGNWPSTTGNKSGGSRGNAPTKKG